METDRQTDTRTNATITISLPRIHVLGIINALAVRITRHNSKNTTNDFVTEAFTLTHTHTARISEAHTNKRNWFVSERKINTIKALTCFTKRQH